MDSFLCFSSDLRGDISTRRSWSCVWMVLQVCKGFKCSWAQSLGPWSVNHHSQRSASFKMWHIHTYPLCHWRFFLTLSTSSSRRSNPLPSFAFFPRSPSSNAETESQRDLWLFWSSLLWAQEKKQGGNGWWNPKRKNPKKKQNPPETMDCCGAWNTMKLDIWDHRIRV